MVVFALTVLGFGIDPKVAGDESFPIGPKEGLKVDATHHSPVFTASMVGDQFHLLGTLSKVVSSTSKSPRSRLTSSLASCHNASVSGDCLCSRRVKAS